MNTPNVTHIETLRSRLASGGRVSVDELLSWISSKDADLLGAAFQVLITGATVVDGAVDATTADGFIIDYLVATLGGKNATATVFTTQPYVAAHELARLYKLWRRAPAGTTEKLSRIREELARVYRTATAPVRKCVTHGTLEHIFEDPTCINDFAEWEADAALHEAFGEAMSWVAGRAPSS